MKSSQTVYNGISSAFCILVVISNIISVKMVQIPYIQDLNVPAGLIVYPLTFLISDFITEIFGAREAKRMVYTAFIMNLLGFAIIAIALRLPSPTGEDQASFQSILGLSSLRIFTSLTAYLVSQIVDVQLYALIKLRTGQRFLWFRNNASVWVSQLVDTLIVDILYLWWGLQMPFVEVWPIMVFSYVYKTLFSVMCTPIFYICVYLGKNDYTKPSKRYSHTSKLKVSFDKI